MTHPTRDELQAKHGTPREFEEACRNALGEISYREMEVAVEKYRTEWADAECSPDCNGGCGCRRCFMSHAARWAAKEVTR